MIYVEMNGRLGNQLFRYAFARWLQIKGEEKDRELILDFRNIEREARKGEVPGWEDSLRYFKVQNYRYYDKAGRPAWNELTASEKAVMGICALLEKAAGKKGPLARLSVRKRFYPGRTGTGSIRFLPGMTTLSAGKEPCCKGRSWQAPANVPDTLRKSGRCSLRNSSPDIRSAIAAGIFWRRYREAILSA
jgi:hypothetical protein